MTNPDRKKAEKKLDNFLGSSIELKKFNFLVKSFHKINQKGGGGKGGQ